MVALLTCLLSIFSCIPVNSYTKSTDEAIRVDGAWSGTGDDHRSWVSCPSSLPTLVSCGLSTDDVSHDGSYSSSAGICEAINGYGPYGYGGGVSASATCVGNDYTCTSHTGKYADEESTVDCTDPDEIMVSCSPHTGWARLRGSYVGKRHASTTTDSATLCTAYREIGDGKGVWAEGICCKYNGNDGYQLECKTEWGLSSVSCSSGYEMWGCSSFSPNGAATYKIFDNECRAESASVHAIATCCILHKDPTPEPTNLPTVSPTDDPTANPTLDPTVNPTAGTADPSVDPTVEPSTNPTNVPTLIPSVTATYEEYDVVTESDDDTSAFESTVYEHNSSGKGNTKASNLLVTYIVIAAVLVSAICIAFIIYEYVIRANRRFPTDTNQKAPSLDLYPKAPSLDATRPPGEESIELSGIVTMVKDEETSHSLYDQMDIDPYHTPIATAGENRMASLPLPALPSDAPNMQSLPLDDGDDEGSDSDGLYVAVVAQTTRMPSLPRKASRMASFPVPELSRDDEASDSDMDVLYGRGKPSKQTSCNSPKLPREASRLPSLPLPELSHDDESSDSNMDGLDGHGKPPKQASCNSDKLPREASRMSHGDACSVSSDSNMDGLYGHGKPTKQTTPN
eukprot:1024745_1